MSDAIRDVLAEIFGERGDKELGRALGVAHTTIMRARAGRYIPSTETVERIATLATPEQAQRLRLAVALAMIRIGHPESAHPDPVGLASGIAGESDPVLTSAPDAATYREALRLAVAAARVAAASAPQERRRKVAVLARRLSDITDRLAGVSHG